MKCVYNARVGRFIREFPIRAVAGPSQRYIPLDSSSPQAAGGQTWPQTIQWWSQTSRPWFTDKRKIVLHGGGSWKRLYAHVVGAPTADDDDDDDDAGGQTVRGDPGSTPVATHDRRPCNCVGRGPGQRTSSPTASNGRPGTRPGAASTRRRRRPSLRRRRTGQDTAAIVPEAETELHR